MERMRPLSPLCSFSELRRGVAANASQTRVLQHGTGLVRVRRKKPRVYYSVEASWPEIEEIDVKDLALANYLVILPDLI